MAKVPVDWDQYLHETLDALINGGLLLTSVDPNGKPNPMTIGWAAFGIFWGHPVVTVMVRPSRYTFACIEATGDFTVSVPYRSLSDKVIYCGTTSGRDVDKFDHCAFTPETSDEIASPGIAQCGVIYYCEVVHTNDVQPPRLDSEIDRTCYPSGDYHRFYHGVLKATVADPDFAHRYRQEASSG